MTNLDNLIKDLNKAVEIRRQVNDLNIKIDDPVEAIVKYALDTSIISSSSDIIKLAGKIPNEILQMISKEYDKKQANRINSYQSELTSYYSTSCYRCGYGGCGSNCRC